MARRLVAAGRLFLIYGVPFGVIVIADKLPSMQGYATSIIFACIAWMFGFHFLVNERGKKPNSERSTDAD